MDDYKKYYYQRIGNEKVSIQKDYLFKRAGSFQLFNFVFNFIFHNNSPSKR